MRTVLAPAASVALLIGLAACGSDDGSLSQAPHIVVTTGVLGDVVRSMVGDGAEVEVIMGPGADPHDFSPSPKQVAAMRQADALIVNGGGFEAGLLDTIESAEADGVEVITALDQVGGLPDDPHFFTDPVRMAKAIGAMADTLDEVVPALDSDALSGRAADLQRRIGELDHEVEALLSPIRADRRLLVTNHEAFGHFADRYGFTILGAIIPSFTTGASASAADLADLAALVRERGVRAIFAETSSPKKLADALAAEVGDDVDVVELYSESLGREGSGADTYIGMIRTDAQRIARALT